MIRTGYCDSCGFDNGIARIAVSGPFHEELAILCKAKQDMANSIYFANLAIDDLSKSKDPIFIQSIAKRLERLKQILNMS